MTLSKNRSDFYYTLKDDEKEALARISRFEQAYALRKKSAYQKKQRSTR